MLLLCLTLPNKVEFFWHLEPEHSPEACLEHCHYLRLCFHSEIEIYCLQLTKEIPFNHLHKLPPNFTHSKSKFLRVSLLLAGQMLLEMPEAKEFAVAFTFDLHLRWCLELLGTVLFHPFFCLRGGYPSLLCYWQCYPISLPFTPARSQFQRSSAGCSC